MGRLFFPENPAGGCNVNIQIVVALIALATAVIVALFQYFGNRRTSIALKQLEANQEKEKETFTEFMKAYLNSITDGRGKEIAGFEMILLRTQVLREELRLIASNLPIRDREKVKEKLAVLVNDVVEAYASHQTHLDESARQLAHNVKNCAVDCLEAVVIKDVKSAKTELLRRADEIGGLQSKLRFEASQSASRYVAYLEKQAAAKFDRTHR